MNSISLNDLEEKVRKAQLNLSKFMAADLSFMTSEQRDAHEKEVKFFLATAEAELAEAKVSTMPFQDDTIQQYVSGRTFADVGGLWGTYNEKVSVALRSGARTATMIDIVPDGHDLWTKFHAHVREKGFVDYDTFSGQNIDDPAVPARTGIFEFVHCSGIIYHAPAPLLILERLRALTSRYLLLGSMIVPDVVEVAGRKLDFTGGRTVFIPGLDEPTRQDLAVFFGQQGLEIMHINASEAEPFRVDGAANYGPWWWLYSSTTLAKMVESAGFRVISKAEIWDGRSAYIFAERDDA